MVGNQYGFKLLSSYCCGDGCLLFTNFCISNAPWLLVVPIEQEASQPDNNTPQPFRTDFFPGLGIRDEVHCLLPQLKVSEEAFDSFKFLRIFISIF